MVLLRELGYLFNEFILGWIFVNCWGILVDLVGLVVFLVFNVFDFVNGYILYVDGGILVYIGK